MAEVSVRLKVPAGYEKVVRHFVDEIESEEVVRKSFKRCLEIELKKRLLKDIASRSTLTAKEASELSEEAKKRWVSKHSG